MTGEQRGRVTLIPQRRIDPLLEAKNILEGRACALRGDSEEYLCGGAAAAAHYLSKYRGVECDEQLYRTAKRYSDAAGHEEPEGCDGMLAQALRPIAALAEYVLDNLEVEDGFVRRYFGVPQEGLFSVGGMVSELRDRPVSREEAAAFFFAFNSDDDEFEPARCNKRMTLDEFVRETGESELPDSYRWLMCETLASWDDRRREIDDVLRRAADLVRQKEQTVQPLVDVWYEDTVRRLEETGHGAFLSESCGIKLGLGREMLLIPSVENFMSITLTLMHDDISSLRRASIRSGMLAYGIYVDLLREFAARKDAGQRLAGTLRVLGDKQRFKIMSALLEHPMYTSDIIKLTGLTAATVSHHMSELLGEGLIEMNDSGNRIINSVSREGCRRFVEALEAMFLPGGGRP